MMETVDLDRCPVPIVMTVGTKGRDGGRQPNGSFPIFFARTGRAATGSRTAGLQRAYFRSLSELAWIAEAVIRSGSRNRRPFAKL
ncbi:hypothetical protein [Chelativorans sp. YIM 93263]|uniref:hypothetical protein n=1 Tax=Chelativorans sp. YIM 93263 TaxID=2906648 RepID=UPI002377E7F6|nr:hypothetical protein [Chelativorans sp. YIM 93263]